MPLDFITNSVKGGLELLIRVAGSSITHSSTVYRTFQGDSSNKKDLDNLGGGFIPDFDVAFFVIKADFATVPVIGEKVTDADSTTYRIVQTISSTRDPAMALLCVGVNK